MSGLTVPNLNSTLESFSFSNEIPSLPYLKTDYFIRGINKKLCLFSSSSQVRDYSILLNTWEDFGTFLHAKVSGFSNSSDELLVASSDGIGKQVKKGLVNAYLQQGIEILGINHCLDVSMDNTKSLEFLRGNGPTWEIFRLNDMAPDLPENLVNPLVQRDLTDQIIQQVVKMNKTIFKKKTHGTNIRDKLKNPQIL